MVSGLPDTISVSITPEETSVSLRRQRRCSVRPFIAETVTQNYRCNQQLRHIRSPRTLLSANFTETKNIQSKRRRKSEGTVNNLNFKQPFREGNKTKHGHETRFRPVTPVKNVAPEPTLAIGHRPTRQTNVPSGRRNKTRPTEDLQ